MKSFLDLMDRIFNISQVKKSLDGNISVIEKSSNWGNKIPVKKRTSDGRTITYWVSPEDLNQGKAKGQMNLFDDNEQGPEPEDSYYSQLDKNTELYKIKPLCDQFKETESEHPGLSSRIAQKYVNYMWGRETRDLDIDLDYEIADYYKKVSKHPEYKKEYYKDFIEATNKTCKMLNNRKLAMARLKKGSEVTYKGQKTKIVGFSERGYPQLEIDGKKQSVFVDEIANIDELIEKYGEKA